MKEQTKTSEGELSSEEIANLSDGEFKALVIKVLTELIELGREMKEEVKATQSEIKPNIQGTNSEGRETDSNQRFGTKRRNKHPTRTEWRNKNVKNKERLRNLWDNFKPSNI